MFRLNTYETLGIPVSTPLEFSYDTDDELIDHCSEDDPVISISKPSTSSTNVKTCSKKRTVKKREPRRKQMVSLSHLDQMFSSVLKQSFDTLNQMATQINFSEDKMKIFLWLKRFEADLATKTILQTELQTLFTRTTEDKFTSKSNQILQDGTVAQALLSLNISGDSGLTAKEELTGANLLLREIFSHGKRYREPDLSEQENVKHAQEDLSAFYYVVGAMLRTIKKSDLGKRIVADLTSENHPIELANEVIKWVKAQDRGGLMFPTKEAFSFFSNIIQHVNKYFNKENCQITDRKRLVKEALKSDVIIQRKWNLIRERNEVPEKQGEKIYEQIINCFINTCASGHVRLLKDELRAEQRKKAVSASLSKKSLRAQLAEISNSIKK